MRGTDLSRLGQYEIQMRVIEIFQGGLIKLSTRIVCDGYIEKSPRQPGGYLDLYSRREAEMQI